MQENPEPLLHSQQGQSVPLLRAWTCSSSKCDPECDPYRSHGHGKQCRPWLDVTFHEHSSPFWEEAAVERTRQGLCPAARSLGSNSREGGRSANEFTLAQLDPSQCQTTLLRSAEELLGHIWLSGAVLKISTQANVPTRPAAPLSRGLCWRVNFGSSFI